MIIIIWLQRKQIKGLLKELGFPFNLRSQTSQRGVGAHNCSPCWMDMDCEN